jgi:hypothetical protein
VKPHPLPAVTLGLDVASPEGALPEGAVRRAENVVLLNDGSFQRRPGYAELSTLDGAHSLWRSPAQTRAFCAAGDTLYEVDPDTGGVAPLFVGLLTDQPVEYCDVGPDVYFTSGGILRKVDPAGAVRRPGIIDLMGASPMLTAAAGGLLPGRYGVAYSLVNDLGEESPISAIAWIDLPTGGGIALSGLQTAADVQRMTLYVTTPNGSELYHHRTVAYAATGAIVDQTRQRPAEKIYKQPMPGGEFVRGFRGRLYVATGRWLWISDPLDYGVSDVRGGWKTLNRTITMIEPVEGGIFIGLRERTYFLRGSGPEDFVLTAVSSRGALAHSSQQVAADYFSPELAASGHLPVAVWLSEAGLAVGRPDGSIVYPQSGRLTGLTGGASRPAFVQQGGIKQGIFSTEALAIGVGGAVDVTI